MSSPIITTTIQASVLAAASNLMAQLLAEYKSNVRPAQQFSVTYKSNNAEAPYTIDWVPVFQFIVFTIVNCPPNFLW